MQVGTRERIVGATVFAGERILRRIETVIGRGSLVGEATFFEPVGFAWTRRIEHGWPKIPSSSTGCSRTGSCCRTSRTSRSTRRASPTTRVEDLLPLRLRLPLPGQLRPLPGDGAPVRGDPGDEDGLLLDPRARQAHRPHRGPYKGVLRYHLGLKIPEPADGCGIRVGDDVRQWSEGGSLVFDDTYDHEAWNETDDVRVVLFVDFVRPLRLPASLVNRLVLAAIAWSPFIGDAKRRQNDWERRFESLKARREPAAAA